MHAGPDDRGSAEQAQRATGLEALALLLFGGLAGVVTLMMIAQPLSRQMYLDAAEYPALRAVGMTSTQVVGIRSPACRHRRHRRSRPSRDARRCPLAVHAMPIGVARQAEVSPGISVDLWVLGIGSLTVVAVLAGWAGLAAWRAARQSLAGNPAAVSGTGRSSRLADGVGRAGLTPSATIGIRMALDPGRGATTVPVRTTLLSAVIAVGLLVATLTFGTNLTRLAQRPGLQGWNWDLSVGNPHSDDVAEQAIPLLTANPSVSEFTAIAGGDGGATIQVGDQPVGIFGVTTVRDRCCLPSPPAGHRAGPTRSRSETQRYASSTRPWRPYRCRGGRRAPHHADHRADRARPERGELTTPSASGREGSSPRGVSRHSGSMWRPTSS